MSRLTHNRHFTAAIGLLTAGLMVLAMAAPVAAASPGNNGTVKIHNGSSEAEPIIQNEPHVCDFHLHFFFSDPGQAGDWWIQSWPPTGDKTTVMSGTYLSDSNGEYRDPAVGSHSLPDGHYKLFWQGGTFTTIENDHYMLVRDESDGTTVGRFPMGFLLGDSATITFAQPIHIQQILWHDNDPKVGEAGWSFNGITAPLTGNQMSVYQTVDLTTSVVNIDAGGDSGGIDFCF